MRSTPFTLLTLKLLDGRVDCVKGMCERLAKTPNKKKYNNLQSKVYKLEKEGLVEVDSKRQTEAKNLYHSCGVFYRLTKEGKDFLEANE